MHSLIWLGLHWKGNLDLDRVSCYLLVQRNWCCHSFTYNSTVDITYGNEQNSGWSWKEPTFWRLGTWSRFRNSTDDLFPLLKSLESSFDTWKTWVPGKLNNWFESAQTRTQNHVFLTEKVTWANAWETPSRYWSPFVLGWSKRVVTWECPFSAN